VCHVGTFKAKSFSPIGQAVSSMHGGKGIGMIGDELGIGPLGHHDGLPWSVATMRIGRVGQKLPHDAGMLRRI
jgi:hypothetical protein